MARLEPRRHDHAMLSFVLNLASAGLAILAAVFWFRSAWGRIPQPVLRYGGFDPADPFFKALDASAKSNRIAALLAGLSALLMAGAIGSAAFERPEAAVGSASTSTAE